FGPPMGCETCGGVGAVPVPAALHRGPFGHRTGGGALQLKSSLITRPSVSDAIVPIGSMRGTTEAASVVSSGSHCGVVEGDLTSSWCRRTGCGTVILGLAKAHGPFLGGITIKEERQDR
ncbi:hypothetical protein ACLOJK_006499, partial [Asimina triloba]